MRHGRWSIGSVALKETVWRDCWKANDRDGPAAWRKNKPGRPRRLAEKQMEAVDRILRQPPREAGLSGNIWDGKTLSTWIEQKYDVDIGVRQCQRMFRQLGFRLRKPRPALAQANPQLQKAQKKNSKT